MIAKFWKDNEHLAETEWKALNPYHNMWAAPPKLVNVQDSKFLGGGVDLQTQIWESSRKVMEEWTGMHLAPCSMWGVRIYYNDSILAPHVDRNPLVTSAIINVAQDVDEDWPLEVWGHDGKPYNISMKPGDMVLYESHSILHGTSFILYQILDSSLSQTSSNVHTFNTLTGRPFPMRGRFYANIFVHFEPIGALSYDPNTPLADIIMDQEGQDAMTLGLPPYLIPGSDWEVEWHKANPRGWELLHSDVHLAARKADFKVLKNVAIQNPTALHEPDDNGWHPLHEAARSGHHDVVKFLLEAGADVNELTNHGQGQSPLALAKQHHGDDHPLVEFLVNYGALELGPDL